MSATSKAPESRDRRGAGGGGTSPDASGEPRTYQGVIQPKGFPGLPAGWMSEWETFPSADGRVQLFGVLHRPREWKGSKILVVFHGLHEHGGRYLHFPHYLQGCVDAVYCVDWRGHGRSEGLRGHIDSFSQLTGDCALTVRRAEAMVHKRFGSAETHVFAHSFGGLIAMQTAFHFTDLPIRSLAISAPLLGIRVKIPLAKRVAARTLSKLWGSLQLATEVEGKGVSHDPEVVTAYMTDRLVHRKGTPRLYTELTATIEDTLKHPADLVYPTLFQVPLADPVVDSEATLKLVKELKGAEIELRTYPGFFHESFNEIGKEKPFEDLRNWIGAHGDKH